MTELPDPLTPPDCDLRDFDFMPLDVVRLRDSDMAAVEDAEVFRSGVLSWCVSWHQVPAASLPDDDKAIARLIGMGRDAAGFTALREAGALRGFVKCSDGRLYHPVVAEKAITAWEAKGKQRNRTAAARAARLSQRQSQTPQKPVAKSVTEKVTGSKGQVREKDRDREEGKDATAAAATPPKKPEQPNLIDFVLPDWVPQKPWDEFVAMRRRIRAPLTDHAKDLIVKELAALRTKGDDPGAVLDQSTRKGWRDVFKLKTEGGRDGRQGSQQPSFNQSLIREVERRGGGGLLEEGDSGDGPVIEGRIAAAH